MIPSGPTATTIPTEDDSVSAVLDLSPRLTVLPIVYGSGEFALRVRQRLRRSSYDCLALALPPSLGPLVEEGVGALPRISVVVQSEASVSGSCTYVPIDPCQGIIAAVREAVQVPMFRDLNRRMSLLTLRA